MAVAAQRLVPVLQLPTTAAAVARTRSLLHAGCRVVELTTTVLFWLWRPRNDGAGHG